MLSILGSFESDKPSDFYFRTHLKTGTPKPAGDWPKVTHLPKRVQKYILFDWSAEPSYTEQPIVTLVDKTPGSLGHKNTV